MFLRNFTLLLTTICFSVQAEETTRKDVASLAELAHEAAGDGRTIRLKPGVYRMADYLTEAVLADIRQGIDRTQRRPAVPMFVFRGNHNRIEAEGAVIEIDTALYAKLPPGYRRCLIIQGTDNTLTGLTVRNTGQDQGSGGNILSVAGARTVLEDVELHVHGSFPYGYGDLLGKGGPNLLRLQKQSGIQVLGSGSILRRCRVFSRALGHCFYVQEGTEIRLENCLAEGAMRPTLEMLQETSGPAFELGFRSVYENRDGRFVITPGYTKSLVEDGFRTYGSAGRVTLINCTAINTRAGFEIGAPDDAPERSLLENCTALGCERAFLIGSQTVVRRGRGDVVHGPLLYLRGGRNSEVDIELTGPGPRSLVHALATLAGTDHRVRLRAAPGIGALPNLPILLGFGMPNHGEMASPIRPAEARGLFLDTTIAGAPVYASELARDNQVETLGSPVDDRSLRQDPGPWNPPPPAARADRPD